VVKKAAFTLIELIFAIVIIGISVISLPMMNQVISKSIENNIVQEAIFAAATQLNEVVTAHWDDNVMETTSTSNLAKVIDTGFCETNSSHPRYRLMPGHINQPLHRRCLDSNTTTMADANVNAVNSLDDMEHSNQNIFVNATSDKTGYKNTYYSTLSVTRPADFNGNNPNIKEIKITIKDNDSNITSLKTYSANIGEVDYYKKEY
jgi:prepilin-type N-terminal cleavage/methylation domain-containing protein